MKTPPKVLPPLLKSDFAQAKRILGREPGQPVGVVMSEHGLQELRAYGCRFPCPVAVDPAVHREAIEWFYLPENFQPYADFIRA